MVDERTQAVLDRLKANGTRVTGPRRALLSVLTASPGHLNATELAGLVQDAHPEVHQSTVYRTLEKLVDLGVVEHIHVAHGPAVYHLAEDHHIHLVCGACGRVIDAPATMLDEVVASVRDQFGFALAAGHVALTGRCAECASADGEHAHPHPHSH